MKKGETFERMKSISAYFKNHADSNELFKPEFEASYLINSKINGSEELTISDINKMISKINEAEDQDHYDGSGWMDYKMCFSALMKKNGFEVSQGYNDKMKIKTVANNGYNSLR